MEYKRNSGSSRLSIYWNLFFNLATHTLPSKAISSLFKLKFLFFRTFKWFSDGNFHLQRLPLSATFRFDFKVTFLKGSCRHTWILKKLYVFKNRINTLYFRMIFINLVGILICCQRKIYSKRDFLQACCSPQEWLKVAQKIIILLLRLHRNLRFNRYVNVRLNLRCQPDNKRSFSP